jgi:hypothetical protein
MRSTDGGVENLGFSSKYSFSGVARARGLEDWKFLVSIRYGKLNTAKKLNIKIYQALGFSLTVQKVQILKEVFVKGLNVW